ncbi:MAG: hypothetical protein ABGZ35_08495, partial [Planctomycetaceae bacterium]
MTGPIGAVRNHGAVGTACLADRTKESTGCTRLVLICDFSALVDIPGVVALASPSRPLKSLLRRCVCTVEAVEVDVDVELLADRDAAIVNTNTTVQLSGLRRISSQPRTCLQIRPVDSVSDRRSATSLSLSNSRGQRHIQFPSGLPGVFVRAS